MMRISSGPVYGDPVGLGTNGPLTRTVRDAAIHAHPDDIEFQCAGTLLLLRRQGCEVIVATMTALTGWLLTDAGRDPSMLVGGIALNFEGSYRIGSGRDFVIEGDEYDSAFFDKTAKFLKYLPDIAVVNNIEFDHADIYADLDAVRLAFRRLVNLEGFGLPPTRPEDAPKRSPLPLEPNAITADWTPMNRARADSTDWGLAAPVFMRMTTRLTRPCWRNARVG